MTEGRVNGDPTVVYGAGDDAYVVALVIKDLDKPRDPDPDVPRDEARTVVYKSSDGGRTWAEASRFQFIDREFIMLDETGGKYDGRIYIVGQGSVRGIGGPSDRRAHSLQMFRSLDGGKSFTKHIGGGTLQPMKLSDPKTLTFHLSDVRSLRQGKDLESRLLNLDTRVFAKIRKAEEPEKKQLARGSAPRMDGQPPLANTLTLSWR